MSPDIHWHVGEDKDQETIAQSVPARRSRRGWLAILIVIILGAGLGAAYRSLPEPAPHPAPTLSPTPRHTPTPPPDLPADLYAVIDREAQALADGDVEAIIALHEPQSASTTAWLRNNLKAWGRPSDDRPLYEIIDFNLHLPMNAWIDVRQARDERWFREMRFYQFDAAASRWLHSELDPSFWQGTEAQLVTQHFTLTYAVEDHSYISVTGQALEQDYEILCRQLGCMPNSTAPKIQVTLRGNEIPIARYYFSASASTRTVELRLPSPRIAGIFEPVGPDALDRRVMWLAHILAEREAQIDLANTQAGNVIVQTIRDWAASQIDSRFDPRNHPLNPLGRVSLLPLEKIWSQSNRERTQAYYQAGELIYFVDQEYGAQAVAQLLHVLGSATSMRDTLESGLGVPFAEFDQKWKAWARQNISEP